MYTLQKCDKVDNHHGWDFPKGNMIYNYRKNIIRCMPKEIHIRYILKSVCQTLAFFRVLEIYTHKYSQPVQFPFKDAY